MTVILPEGFIWGVSSSAHQIEGAWNEDGKGESIWDRFTHTPGRILGDANADVACDHYHRWREDITLMAELGVTGYRFSVAWTRIIPDGGSEINEAGVAFYSDLVDALLAHGITPLVTLYHWDLPQVLQERGGWVNRGTVDAFARYADAVSSALGDRVQHWITHNEPWVASMLGYLNGVHAPGVTDWSSALAAAHHLLLSHGRAVPILRENSPGAQVGIALDCRPSYPASIDPADLQAQRHFDGYRNRWFFDPVFGRGYPADVAQAYREAGRIDNLDPFELPGDMDEIAAPIDFLGLNYYTSVTVGAGSQETDDPEVAPGPEPPDGFTEMGWNVTPSALTSFLLRIHEEYSPNSILITENGASYSDGPDESGVVNDLRRIAYIESHLVAIASAIEAGVPATGYFHWSLMDNFEWALAYSQRFGLIWTDTHTGLRLPKKSFDWYRRVIAANGIP